MKKTIIILIISLFAFSSVKAQSLSMGKGEKIILNLYSDIWQGADSSVTVNGFNPGFAFYFMYHVPFGKSKFSFNIGFGFGSHNLNSDASPAKEMTLDTALGYVYTGNTVFNRIPESVNNKKIEYDVNKLSITYFDVPVELKYTSENKKGKAIKLAVGFKAGYVVNNHTKYRGDDFSTLSDGEEIKFKSFKIPNIEPLRYGATARFSYGMFGVFGYYSLSKIFKTGHGPEMYPISAGVSLSFL